MLEARTKPSHDYGCHIIILAAPHKRTHPALTPASKAGTWFTYPRGMEGWADLGALTAPRPGIETTTAWSKVWRPNCRCVRPYLDSKTASTIAPSIVHSKLDYCNSLFLSLKQTASSRFRTVLHVQWLKLLNLLMSHHPQISALAQD